MIPSQYLLFAKIGLAGALLLGAGWVGHAWTDSHYQAVLARMAADSQKLVADKNKAIADLEQARGSFNDKLDAEVANGKQAVADARTAFERELANKLRDQKRSFTCPRDAQTAGSASDSQLGTAYIVFPRDAFERFGRTLGERAAISDNDTSAMKACKAYSLFNGRTE